MSDSSCSSTTSILLTTQGLPNSTPLETVLSSAWPELLVSFVPCDLHITHAASAPFCETDPGPRPAPPQTGQQADCPGAGARQRLGRIGSAPYDREQFRSSPIGTHRRSVKNEELMARPAITHTKHYTLNTTSCNSTAIDQDQQCALAQDPTASLVSTCNYLDKAHALSEAPAFRQRLSVASPTTGAPMTDALAKLFFDATARCYLASYAPLLANIVCIRTLIKHTHSAHYQDSHSSHPAKRAIPATSIQPLEGRTHFNSFASQNFTPRTTSPLKF